MSIRKTIPSFPRSFRRKYRSICLLMAFVVLITILYPNIHYKSSSNNMDHLHKIPYQTRSIPSLSLPLHDMPTEKGNERKRNPQVCPSSTVIYLNDQLKEEIRIHSNSQNITGNTISVPHWQINLQYANKTENYFLSAVVRLRLYAEDKAKWTTKELKQWIHYQLWAGAEHVYICNHFLNETEKIDSYLEKYVGLGIVTIIPWTNITAVPNSKTYQTDNADNQIACYNHVLKTYGKHSEWQYNFDMDENPFVPGDYCEGFLVRFIRSMTEGNPGIAEFRVGNYVLQGQGDRSRDLIYDRINRISWQPYNGNVKPIYKVSLTNEAGMHGAKTRGKCIRPGPRQIKMLHYWGARKQNWGPDTQHMLRSTTLFNDVRHSLAVSLRHSLIAFGDMDAFSADTGP